jgi:ketosteroid isomerase-like protein
MSAEANKARAAIMVQDAIGSERIDRTAFTDDATWEFVGTLNLPIDAYIEQMRRVSGTQFLSSGRVDIRRSTADDNTVVVEADVLFTLKDQSEYRNTYCCVISFSGEKICQVKCYYDTAHMRRVFRALS